jgi:hypothetical protein
MHPKELGGLGVKNLLLLNHVLWMRWRWLELVDDEIPWKGLGFKLSEEAEEMFPTRVKQVVGDGNRLCFWTDRWLEGRSILQLAPNLISFVSPGALSLTVANTLEDDAWVAGIRGSPSIPAIAEFLDVWGLVEAQQLGQNEDTG